MSSNYKKRSDYFKQIATDSKLIAHNQPVSVGSASLRKSFHRVNDMDELNAACVNWAHFPCVVHVGHDKYFKTVGAGMPHRRNGNHLLFLAKINRTTYPALADAIEAAYDEADTAMSKFISYMREDYEVNQCCGNLFLFDLNNAVAEQTGPDNDTLFGWSLVFYDEDKACELAYKTADWFTGVLEGVDDNTCGGDDGPGTSGSGEIIYFEDETIVEIEMTDERKQKLGQMPLIQVWFLQEDETYQKVNVPIGTDEAPPNVGMITVYNTGPATGFITLKRTV